MRSGVLYLTHNRRYPLTTPLLHSLFRITTRYTSNIAKMASTDQWPAAKVRSTFIKFFEKNEHKFGKAFIFNTALARSQTNCILSTFFFGCASLRSYSLVHQCWYEPVQVHIPRYCRPFFRFRPIETSSQFAKGQHCWRIVRIRS